MTHILSFVRRPGLINAVVQNATLLLPPILPKYLMIGNNISFLWHGNCALLGDFCVVGSKNRGGCLLICLSGDSCVRLFWSPVSAGIRCRSCFLSCVLMVQRRAGRADRNEPVGCRHSSGPTESKEAGRCRCVVTMYSILFSTARTTSVCRFQTTPGRKPDFKPLGNNAPQPTASPFLPD